MRGRLLPQEDAEMWNNLDGCEEWAICENLEEAKESFNREVEEDEIDSPFHLILPSSSRTSPRVAIYA